MTVENLPVYRHFQLKNLSVYRHFLYVNLSFYRQILYRRPLSSAPPTTLGPGLSRTINVKSSDDFLALATPHSLRTDRLGEWNERGGKSGNKCITADSN